MPKARLKVPFPLGPCIFKKVLRICKVLLINTSTTWHMACCESFSPSPKNNQNWPNVKKQLKQVSYNKVRGPASSQKRTIFEWAFPFYFWNPQISVKRVKKAKWLQNAWMFSPICIWIFVLPTQAIYMPDTKQSSSRLYIAMMKFFTQSIPQCKGTI